MMMRDEVTFYQYSSYQYLSIAYFIIGQIKKFFEV